MTAGADTAVEADTAPAYGTPEAVTGMQAVPDDESLLEGLADDIRELVIAGPVALLGAGNAATIAGSTAFMAGGPVGLAAAAAGVTGAAGAAYVAHRAHQKERAAQEGKPDPKVAAKAMKAAEQAQKQADRTAKTAARTAGQSRPGVGGRHATGRGLTALKMPSRGPRKGPAGFSLPKLSGEAGSGAGTSRAGGGARPSGKDGSRAGAFRLGKPGSAMTRDGAGKSGGVASTVGKPPTAKSSTPGLPSLSGARPKGGAGAGRAGASRSGTHSGLLSRLAGAGRGSRAGRGSAAGRAGGAAGTRGGFGSGGKTGAHRSARTPVAAARRIAGAVRGKTAGKSGGKAAGKTPGQGAAAAGSGAAGAAKSSRLGRATQAVTGSKMGRAAAGAARGVGRGMKAAAGGAKRGYGSGRAAIAGAASAKGQTPRQIAAATRQAVLRKQAVTARKQGKKVGRVGKLRRRLSRSGLGTAAAGTVAAVRGAKKSAVYSGWAGRALVAAARRQPLPPRPDIAAATQNAETVRQHALKNPPISNRVIHPPSSASSATNSERNFHMPGFGLALKDQADAMVALAASYTPDGMLEWGEDMKILPEVLQAVAQLVEALGRGADSLPIEQTVKNTIPPVVSVQMSASSAAEQIAAMFEIVHKVDLDRIRTPRAGEEKWDLVNNQ